MDPNVYVGEKTEAKLYIGNLDMRITEAALIKMFSPFGKIVHEEFLLHTRGRKRGEPRGFAFIQYSSVEEAKLAKEKMHGRLACGRPLVVRLSSEKFSIQEPHNPSQSGKATKTSLSASSSGQMSRTSKIAAIKNKLKALEGEGFSAKKQKQDDVSGSNSIAHTSVQR
ncbi:uncharacterized protein LOC126801674 [Argentina anserina]|uniref:uncharacterized protein LOC126801674 n=1 Tax=Argentina anserina TaxID=57926 RepID=UPI002176563A|nr:uncharacterized protein LOC126801674 [Potentilla anserina]